MLFWHCTIRISKKQDRLCVTYVKFYVFTSYSERSDFIISSRTKRARSLLTSRGLSKLQNSMPHKSMNICLVSANDVM